MDEQAAALGAVGAAFDTLEAQLAALACRVQQARERALDGDFAVARRLLTTNAGRPGGGRPSGGAGTPHVLGVSAAPVLQAIRTAQHHNYDPRTAVLRVLGNGELAAPALRAALRADDARIAAYDLRAILDELIEDGLIVHRVNGAFRRRVVAPPAGATDG
jgi:hypothetical protein